MKPISKMFLITFCILFSVSCISNGQVKIKERVELNLDIIKKGGASLISSDTTNSVRFEMTWSAPSAEAMLWIQQGSNVLVQTGYVGGGSNILTAVIPEGSYYFKWGFSGSPFATGITAVFKIYANNVLLKEIEATELNTYSYGSISLSIIYPEDECQGTPECTEIKDLEIKISQSDASLCDRYPSEDGIFNFFERDFANNFDIDVCYNLNNDRWKFQIMNALEYVLETCIREGKYNYIFNTTDVKNIPCESQLKAEEDFFRLLTVGRQSGQYFLIEAALFHEGMHKNDFESILNQLIIESDFENRWNQFIIDCDDAKNAGEAKTLALENFRSLIENFTSKLRKKWIERVGKPNSPKRFDYESEMYNDANYKNLINNYVDLLNCIN